MSRTAFRSTRHSMKVLLAACALMVTITACEDSSSSSTTAATVATTSTSTTTSTTVATAASDTVCTGDNPCKVGDTGPGGGVIVYISGSDFPCGPSLANKCNILEVAKGDWSVGLAAPNGCDAATATTVLKCPRGTPDVDGNSSNANFAVGAGLKTTNYLLAHGSGAGTAPAIARAYRGGGKDDWSLMSPDEADRFCGYVHSWYSRMDMCRYVASPKEGWESTVYLTSVIYPVNGGTHSTALALSNGQFTSVSHTAKWGVLPARTFLGNRTSTSASTTTTVKASTTTVKSSTTTAAPTTTVPPTTTTLTCAAGGNCAVGDTGPGGGTVYYVSTAGFTCGVTMGSTCHYLEYAPTTWKAATGATANCSSVGSDNVECVWASANASNYSSTSGAVGNGAANTKAIIDNTGALNAVAAVVAKAYQGGGKSDWFLPSQHEMDELCKFARNQATGNQSVACASSGTLRLDFYAGNYWTSNDGGSGTAITIDLMHGTQAFPNKTIARLIRPVRAF